MKTKGMIVKIKDTYCLVLAKDGTYHKVPLARHRNARLGAEIEFSTTNWMTYVKPVLMVASIIAVILGLGLFKQLTVPQAFAYVSLDINPSVELEVGPDLKVIATHAMNKDANNLLTTLNLEGKHLYTSVNSIMAEAFRKGYFKPGQKNYVLSTIAVKPDSSRGIDYDSLADNLKNAVENKGVNIEVVILPTDISVHNEAKNEGVTAGKLTIYKQAVASGDKVTLEEIKQNSLTKLINDHKIKLSPVTKDAVIIEIPPRGASIHSWKGSLSGGTDKSETLTQNHSSGEKQEQGDENKNREQENENDKHPGKEGGKRPDFRKTDGESNHRRQDQKQDTGNQPSSPVSGEDKRGNGRQGSYDDDNDQKEKPNSVQTGDENGSKKNGSQTGQKDSKDSKESRDTKDSKESDSNDTKDQKNGSERNNGSNTEKSSGSNNDSSHSG